MTAGAAGAVAARSRPSTARLVVHQFGPDARCFLRNKQSVFWTLALPVLFLVIFGSIFGGEDVAVPGGRIDEPAYYVPGIIAFGVISATFTNLVISVVHHREVGIYKRRRATPVSASAIIGARALVSAISAVVLTFLLSVIGWIAFDAHLTARTTPAFLVMVLLGAAAFCCLGFALASVVSNADAAQPVVMAVVLPLCFISGVFVPVMELPRWLRDVGQVFPVHALADGLLRAYNPHTAGSGFDAADLLVLTAWGVGGIIIAVRRFTWLPHGS